MLEDLIIQPEDSSPIYQQLESQLQRFIRAGRLKPGDALPSVRAMAVQLAVNPMTVSKTINRLVEQGWLVHRRGKACCVAQHLPAEQGGIDTNFKAETLTLISHSKQLQLSEQELLALISEYWNTVE